MSNNDQPVPAPGNAGRPEPDRTRGKVLPFARPAPPEHRKGHAVDRSAPPEPPSAA